MSLCVVEKKGFYGSLLEVTESSWTATLLNDLEMEGVVRLFQFGDANQG